MLAWHIKTLNIFILPDLKNKEIEEEVVIIDFFSSVQLHEPAFT